MDWIVGQAIKLTNLLFRIFTTPLFEMGGTPYSIASIGTLILVGIGVFIASRIISGWIKRRLLGRFDRGTREAIAVVISYLLTLIGFIIVLQTAGINLSSLTVLAGVLGIGFGFGLQNLASNFIGGLTLLFEQPIKVGDFVEIDKLSGVVEKISIRSTVIRTNDDVFVIVPNMRFVENQIINWSYNTPKCRIHVPVKVAYGSDPLVVTEALLAAARMEPQVLSSPSPKVWFENFGENALEFTLLVWIDDPDENEPIRSALNFRIEYELRSRKIRIPLPQRELYIHNMDETRKLFGMGADDENTMGRSSRESKETSTDQPALEPKRPSSRSLNNATLKDLLRRIVYFEQCSDLELRQLIEYGYRQLFPMAQIVCQENDPGESFYIILKGSVEVLSQRSDKYIATLHEGEFFGEISLLLGVPRSATVRTLEDTILFVVEHEDMQKLLESHQQLADEIATKLAERRQVLRDMNLLVEDEPEETTILKIRRRLQTLFGI